MTNGLNGDTMKLPRVGFPFFFACMVMSVAVMAIETGPMLKQ